MIYLVAGLKNAAVNLNVMMEHAVLMKNALSSILSQLRLLRGGVTARCVYITSRKSI